MASWGYGSYEGSDDKELLDSVYGGSGYDWSYAAILEDPAGQRYVYTDGGCSCNGPWEDEPDYTPVHTAQEALDAGGFYEDSDKDEWKTIVLDLDWRSRG